MQVNIIRTNIKIHAQHSLSRILLFVRIHSICPVIQIARDFSVDLCDCALCVHLLQILPRCRCCCFCYFFPFLLSILDFDSHAHLSKHHRLVECVAWLLHQTAKCNSFLVQVKKISDRRLKMFLDAEKVQFADIKKLTMQQHSLIAALFGHLNIQRPKTPCICTNQILLYH